MFSKQENISNGVIFNKKHTHTGILKVLFLLYIFLCVVVEQLFYKLLVTVDMAMCAVHVRSSHCLFQFSQPGRDLLIKFRG